MFVQGSRAARLGRMLCCKTKGVYHEAVALAAKKIYFGETARHHVREANYYRAVFCRQSEKLFGQKKEARVLGSSWTVHPKDVLVLTGNPDYHVGEAVKEIAGQVFPRVQRDYPSLGWKSNSRRGGFCLGMCQRLVYEYDVNRSSGMSFEEAAVAAATLFQEGVSFEAEVLQYLHSSCVPNLSGGFMEVVNSKYCGGLSAMDDYIVQSVVHTQKEPLPILSGKVDGTYLLHSGFYLKQGENGKMVACHWPDQSGHMVALFVEDGKALAFDPDFGLWRETESLNDWANYLMQHRNDAIVVVDVRRYV